MKQHLLALAITASSEWKIQIRQRSFWVLAGLFFLIGWTTFNPTSQSLTPAIEIAKNTAQGLGLFGCVFVAIIGATGFLREFQPGYEFLWARSFSSIDYIAGKYLGLCAAVGTALLPVGLWIAYHMVKLHGFLSILILFAVWAAILAITLAFILAITLLTGLIFRRSLWTSLCLVLALAGGLVANLDVTTLSGFAPYGIYVSSLIGYGPDIHLLTLHRAFYFEVTVLVLLVGFRLAWVAVPRWERRRVLGRDVLWAISVVGMMAALLYTAARFKDERNELSINAPPILDNREQISCDLITSYHIDVRLNHETALLDGKANFQVLTLSNSMQIPTSLNSGLELTKVQALSEGVQVLASQDALVLTLPQDRIGHEVSILLEYAGELRTRRRVYDSSDRSPVESLEPYQPGGYLGNTTVFLTRDGNWHPFPDCVPDSLEVELTRAPSPLVHTADRYETSLEWVLLKWDEKPPLPLLAASRNFQEIQLGQASLFIARDHVPDAKYDAVLSPFLRLMLQIESVLQEDKPSDRGPLQVAIVPLIKSGSYDPVSGVIFFPERFAYDYEWIENAPSSGVDQLRSPDLLYQRWAAEKLIRLWWCRDAVCPQLQTQEYNIGIFWVPDENEGRKEVLNALMSYAALRLAEPLVGAEFIHEEMTVRERLLEEPSLWTEQYLPADYSEEINSMMVRLHRFWEKNGPDDFWQLVRTYHRINGASSLPEEEFSRFIEQVTGESLP